MVFPLGYSLKLEKWGQAALPEGLLPCFAITEIVGYPVVDSIILQMPFHYTHINCETLIKKAVIYVGKSTTSHMLPSLLSLPDIVRKPAFPN